MSMSKPKPDPRTKFPLYLNEAERDKLKFIADSLRMNTDAVIQGLIYRSYDQVWDALSNEPITEPIAEHIVEVPVRRRTPQERTDGNQDR